MGSRRGSRRRHSGGKQKMALWKKVLLYFMLAVFLIGSGYVVFLDNKIRSQFEGKRWSVPAYVYARPLQLFPAKRISQTELLYELNRLRYHIEENPSKPGTYSYSNNQVIIYTRHFVHWDEVEKPKRVRINFSGGSIAEITNLANREDVPIMRLDPVVVAKIYPSHNEDRILVQLKDVPKQMIDILKAVEDRNFDNHIGITFKGIFRALWANIRAGRRVQGGSTLTQQLVKNYFLTNRRTLWRKGNEVIMALLLEFHYKKKEILEAYLNEVYLGQDGRRAIHGFGLAAQFYFGRPLRDLKLHQMALLVGMVKGPSLYDPRRRRERALRRRNVVLDVLRKQKLISEDDAVTAKNQPLDVVSKRKSALTAYPAFLDLLRKQLRRDYREEDITTGGLRIFTTLDPIIQYYAEKSIEKQVGNLEKWLQMKPGTMQAALVVTSRHQGEVLAIVGDRNPRYPGFNRAIKARRPIGSLIKPAVYLAALMKGKTLSTILDDSEFEHKSDSGKIWAPKNYDKENHGNVPLVMSLAHSYNITTVRLGLELGLPYVVETIRKLGVTNRIKVFPSLLLGTVEMAPIEVAQMYQTFADGGFRTQLRSIKAVMNSKGDRLQSYPLKPEKVVDSGAVFQLNTAMQVAVKHGTGRGLKHFLTDDFGVAGKTGTTDDKRDSWFSGFAGNYLGVVWLGRDDNQPTGLSGSGGALRVWGELVKHINPQPLKLDPPSDSDKKFEFHWIDPKSGMVTSSHCSGAIYLPYVVGTAPKEQSSCTAGRGRWLDFLRR